MDEFRRLMRKGRNIRRIPLRVRLQMLLDRADVYRDAVIFVYLGGVVGAIVYPAYGLGTTLSGLLIGAGVMYLCTSISHALNK